MPWSRPSPSACPSPTPHPSFIIYSNPPSIIHDIPFCCMAYDHSSYTFLASRASRDECSSSAPKQRRESGNDSDDKSAPSPQRSDSQVRPAHAGPCAVIDSAYCAETDSAYCAETDSAHCAVIDSAYCAETDSAHCSILRPADGCILQRAADALQETPSRDPFKRPLQETPSSDPTWQRTHTAASC